jgi:hypothetical protein
MTTGTWNREAGIVKEDNYGVLKRTDLVPFRYFAETDIWPRREVVELRGGSGSQDMLDEVLAGFLINGSIPDITPVAELLDVLLEGIFGSVAGAAPGLKTYTFASTVPSYSLWMKKGDIVVAAAGVKINELAFEFGWPVMTASMEVKGRSPGTFPLVNFPSVTYGASNKKPFVMGRCTVTWGGDVTVVKSAALTINRGMPDSDFGSGSFYTLEQTEGDRTLTGSLTLTLATKAMLDEFLADACGAGPPEKTLVIAIQSADCTNTLTLTIQRAFMQADDYSVSDSENLHRVEIPFDILKPAAGETFQATLLLT